MDQLSPHETSTRPRLPKKPRQSEHSEEEGFDASFFALVLQSLFLVRVEARPLCGGGIHEVRYGRCPSNNMFDLVEEAVSPEYSQGKH